MRKVTGIPKAPETANEGVPDTNRVDPAPEMARNRHLTNPGKSVTADTDPIDPAPLPETPENGKISVPGKSIYRRYSELQHAYIKLKAENEMLKHPRRTPEQIERELLNIERFLGTMGDSEGAVTAANLYNEDFFAGQYDSKFKVPLLKILLNKYRGAEPLIVPTYNYWIALLEKEQTV